ncbi:uncharacterized protein LOC128547640 [Mercenaria mercenaria]|uniref:uncharacterized protein LOC128547640 n=1 Tax=Mercenaria mercenaria TaxID=6596 RepID=UPI00234F7A06|nr:uncharacterized protein LOC128547640 [Mercenaria mercenaria]
MSQSSSSDVTVSSDSTDTSLSERPRKLRKRKAVDYYPTKGKGKFKVIHQSCPRRKKMARSIDPFLSRNSRDSKRIESMEGENTEMENGESTGSKHYLTDNLLENSSVSTTRNDRKIVSSMQCEFSEAENLVNSGRAHQKKDCSLVDQSVGKSNFQKIFGVSDLTTCMELDGDKLQNITTENSSRSFNDFAETESLPDIENSSAENESLFDVLHGKTGENRDNQHLPANKNLKIFPSSESSNGCTNTLMNCCNQGYAYSLRKKPPVDYLETKIDTFGTDTAVKTKLEAIQGRKNQKGNTKYVPSLNSDFEISDSDKGDTFQSNGQQNQCLVRQLEDKENTLKGKENHTLSDGIATRKRHRKTKSFSEQCDGNESLNGHSLRKSAKFDYFATKTGNLSSESNRQDERVLRNNVNNGNEKIYKNTDTLKDEKCKTMDTGETNICSNKIQMDIADEEGRATLIGDSIKLNIDQNRGRGTMCNKYNMFDPGVTGDISDNISDDLLIQNPFDDLLIQNPFELDFSSPDLTPCSLQDLKSYCSKDSEEDIFVSGEESVTCSEKISLLGFSSAESNFSPLKSEEEYQMLTRNDENVENNQSKIFDSQDKTNGKVESGENSVSLGTGLNKASSKLLSTVVDEETELLESVQEPKFKNSNSQQTTMDNIFPVIKVNRSIRPSKVRNKNVGISSGIMFGKINGKVSKESGYSPDVMVTSEQELDTAQQGKGFVKIDVFVKESDESDHEVLEENFKLLPGDFGAREKIGRFSDHLMSGRDGENTGGTKTWTASLLFPRMSGNELAADKCLDIVCEKNDNSMSCEIERDVVFEIKEHLSPTCGNGKAEMAEPDSTVVDDDIRIVEKENKPYKSEIKLNSNDKYPGDCKGMKENSSDCSKMNVTVTEVVKGKNINRHTFGQGSNATINCGKGDRNETMREGYDIESRNQVMRSEDCGIENGDKTMRQEDCGKEDRNKTIRDEDCGIESRNKIVRKEDCDIENGNKTMTVEIYDTENGKETMTDDDCCTQNGNKTMRIKNCRKENPNGFRKLVKDKKFKKINKSTAGCSKKSVQQEKLKQSDFMVGSVVWGKFSGNVWWPALVINGDMVKKSTKTGFIWLYWFSDRQISLVKTSCVESFQNTFVTRCKLKKKWHMQRHLQIGIDRALEICARRAGVDIEEFGSIGAWVKSDRGFLQLNSERFKPNPEFPVPADILEDLHCSENYAMSRKNERECRDVPARSLTIPSTTASVEPCGDQTLNDADLVRPDVDGDKICFTCGVKLVEDSYDHPLFQVKICEKCKVCDCCLLD